MGIAEPQDGPVQRVESFLEAENRRDWGLWTSFLHPEVCYEVVGQEGMTNGRDDYVLRMKRAYSEIPDWHFTVLRAHGNKCSVMVEFLGSGHFTGDYGGARYESVPLHLQSVCVFELEDGLICRVREYLDESGFDRQLGVHYD